MPHIFEDEPAVMWACIGFAAVVASVPYWGDIRDCSGRLLQLWRRNNAGHSKGH